MATALEGLANNRIYCFLHYSQQNKKNSLHFIDLLPDYVKKGHAQLAENDQKWKPDLFLNFWCGHSVRTFRFHVCCSHSHWASLSTLPRKRSLPRSEERRVGKECRS